MKKFFQLLEKHKIAVIICFGILYFSIVGFFFLIRPISAPPVVEPKKEAPAEEEKEEEKKPEAEKKEEAPDTESEKSKKLIIKSLSPSKISSRYNPKLIVLTMEGENFGLLPEVWIGDFRVAPYIMVSTDKKITIRELQVYGIGLLWPKKWTITIKTRDSQIATTTLLIGTDWGKIWLVVLIVIVFCGVAFFVWWKWIKK